MKVIQTKISRENLYKKVYDPTEVVVIEDDHQESAEGLLNSLSEFLATMYIKNNKVEEC